MPEKYIMYLEYILGIPGQLPHAAYAQNGHLFPAGTSLPVIE